MAAPLRVLIQTIITSGGRITGGRTTRSVLGVQGRAERSAARVVSPIVLYLPHLRSRYFTTHRKSAVCNALKLEYARLSLQARWGRHIQSIAGRRSFHVLRLFRYSTFASSSYIFKSFLAKATRTPFLFLFPVATFTACVSLYFHPRAESKKKNLRGWVCGRSYAYMRAWLLFDKEHRAVALHSRFCFGLYSFFFSSMFLSWIQLLYFLHWASVTKRRTGWSPHSEKGERGGNGDIGSGGCIWTSRSGC